MKIKKIIPVVLLAAGLSSGLASCGGSNSSNTLNIVCIEASYGVDWINTLVENFKVTHPGVEVNLKADYSAKEIIKSNLASSRNNDDLYICVDTAWKSYAAQSKFLDLTDFLEETVDGVTVKDKIADEFKDSIEFTRSNGEKKVYRLPFTSGIGGIYYNKKMFEDNGWTVPTTFDDLMTLCETIKSARLPVPGGLGTTAVIPFVYGGTDTDYFDYAVFNWWGQLAGVDNIKEFLKYESYENFDASKNETYAALKTATEHWHQLFAKGNGNWNSSNNNLNASDAQKDFINGKAAMMFNCDWLYNDSLVYTNGGSQKDTFELGYMKTPTLSGVTSDNADATYIIGEDQYIAIPATSKHADLAKEFIKEMISDKGCEVFLNKAHGFLAYKADYSKMNVEDTFMQEMIALRAGLNNKFTNFSSNRKYLTSQIDVWCTGGDRPFLSLLNGTYDSSSNPLNEVFQKIANKAKNNWDEWTRKAG
ncbi:MAG: extracellular solute-binding protein [Erysipelotrichales bacterium]|nr:extracellular solute-binding protein [Erysipelotrichales bacterium]